MVTNSKKYMVVSMGIIVGSFLVLGIAVTWLGNNVAERANTISGNRALIKQQAHILETFASLKKIETEVAVYKEKLHGLVPTKNQLIDFPRWVTTLEHLHGVMGTFSFQGAGTDPAPGEIGSNGFTISVTGRAENIVNFFEALEVKSPKFLSAIDSFDVAQSGSGYQVSSHGRVFFR